MKERSDSLKHVRLHDRVAGHSPGWHWYMAGKAAAMRSEFMRHARQHKSKGISPAIAVQFARQSHRESMEYIRAALRKARGEA